MAAASAGGLSAQGVTTAAIAGTVHAADGTPLDGQVVIENTATGFTVETRARAGRFLVEGLQIGGPYRIRVERLGYTSRERDNVFLTLAEPLRLRFVLQPVAIRVDTIRVVARAQDQARGGTGTTLGDSLLHRLPTMDRDLYDFVSLAPQVATGVGMSAGGVGFRLNNFLIQGVRERSLFGSQPPEFAGGRSIPLSAVSEYQVLISPFDVRYGDFAGAVVNAVTRSGTNRTVGSVFAYTRNDGLAREGGTAGGLPYQRVQLGVTAAGPLRRDRLHYFVASELQQVRSRAPGPYVGQPENAVPAVPVDTAYLVRLREIMRETWDLSAGSGTEVVNRDRTGNLFARVDLAVPEWNSRGVAWINVGRSLDQNFSRAPTGAFHLSSAAMTQEFGQRTAGLQVHNSLRRPGGGHNEFQLSHRANRSDWVPVVRQPIVTVAVPGRSGAPVNLVTGTPFPAHGIFYDSWDFTVRDNLTLPLAQHHVATLGGDAEWFRVWGGGVLNAYGRWEFASLDSLARGTAHNYTVERDFGSAAVPLEGAHYSVYAADRWDAGDRLTFTLGIRAEALTIHGNAPYNEAIDSIFDRRTDAMPAARLHLSPRLGFLWDLSDAGQDRLRGGTGIFAGRPPLAWLHSPLVRHGIGTGLLQCGPPATREAPPPAFEPDYRSPPTTCRDHVGLEAPPLGDVDLVDPDLRMARTLRTTVAYDRRLPWGLVGTVEGLVTRNLSDFLFVNLNLRGPRGFDANGRVMYGSIPPGGEPVPDLLADSFPSVIALENTSRNGGYHLTARLEKRFAGGTALTGSYTFSRVRDVQTPQRVLVAAKENWSTGRPVSGRHDRLETGVSLNDIPHRVVLAGTYRTPASRWATEVSLLYVGEAGRPFTYVAWGKGDLGDLNADGSDVNDPIYVPRNVYDTTEIRFSGDTAQVSAQQAAFARFIEAVPCLERQRGSILERNSCRAPWSHTTIASVRQSIPVGASRLEAQLDLFNVLNLLDRDWGGQQVPQTACGSCSELWTRWTGSPAILEHVDQTAGPPGAGQPVLRFDATLPRWRTLRPESAFQVQLAVRYRF